MNTHIITNNTTTHLTGLTNTNANSPRTPTTPIIQILNHLICGFFTSKAKSATRFTKSATLLKNIETLLKKTATLLKKNDKLKIPLLKHLFIYSRSHAVFSFPSSCLGMPISINKALSKLTLPSRSLGAR